MPLDTQVKLLRALEERKVRPVGSASEVPFDARIIAATNRDIEEAMHEGTFRQDLFYRLNIVRVALPPLRARGGDVLLLAQHFLTHFAAEGNPGVVGISKAAAEKLLAYSWPGNVRELQNRVQRAVIMADGKRVTAKDLELGHGLDELPPQTLREARERLEREVVHNALRRHRGRITAAALELGISRPTLYELMERLGIARE